MCSYNYGQDLIARPRKYTKRSFFVGRWTRFFTLGCFQRMRKHRVNHSCCHNPYVMGDREENPLMQRINFMLWSCCCLWKKNVSLNGKKEHLLLTQTVTKEMRHCHFLNFWIERRPTVRWVITYTGTDQWETQRRWVFTWRRVGTGRAKWKDNIFLKIKYLLYHWCDTSTVCRESWDKSWLTTLQHFHCDYWRASCLKRIVQVFRRVCVRYFSIVSAAPTVDGGWYLLSLEKQQEYRCRKLNNELLWTCTAAKHIIVSLKGQYQCCLCYM